MVCTQVHRGGGARRGVQCIRNYFFIYTGMVHVVPVLHGGTTHVIKLPWYYFLKFKISL